MLVQVANNDDGFSVHKAGCGDLRSGKYWNIAPAEDTSSKREIFLAINDDFIIGGDESMGVYTEYSACVSELPAV